MYTILNFLASISFVLCIVSDKCRFFAAHIFIRVTRNVSVKSTNVHPPSPPPGILRAFDERLAPYGGEGGGEFKRNAARPVGHLTIEKLLARAIKLKDYVEKAEATRLRARQQQNK